jgi:hypothetical protein
MTLLRTREFIQSKEYNRQVFLWVSLPVDIAHLSAARFRLNVGRLRSLPDDRALLLGDIQSEYDARQAAFQAEWGNAEPTPERGVAVAEWNDYVAEVDLRMVKRLASFLYEEVRGVPGVTPDDEASWLLLEPDAWWCPDEGRRDTLVLNVLTDPLWLAEISGAGERSKVKLITAYIRTGTTPLKVAV